MRALGRPRVRMNAQIPFAEQYRHPNWQRVRLQMFEFADWQCQNCGARNQNLQVHHRHYVKGRPVWEYTEDELMVLCGACHESLHSFKKSTNELIDFNGPEFWARAFPLIAGYMDGCVALEQMVEGGLSNPLYRLGVIAAMLEALPEDSLKNLVLAVAKMRRCHGPAVEQLLDDWAIQL